MSCETLGTKQTMEYGTSELQCDGFKGTSTTLEGDPGNVTLAGMSAGGGKEIPLSSRLAKVNHRQSVRDIPSSF